MLGKHHLAISGLIVLPFLIPLFFQNIDLILPIILLIAVAIGSLTPDADCGGKSKLHYDFKAIDWIMKKTITPLVLIIFKLISKKKVLEYEVKDEHRGIMHSPIGVLISSFLLTIILLIITLFLESFNFWFITIIFFGLLIGQLLHLLEDSFTISGINWKFPFGTKNIYGKIYTYPRFEDKRDIRPGLFVYSLVFLSLIIASYFMFSSSTLSLWLIYPIILICDLLIIYINRLFAKLDKNFWYRDIKEIGKMKKMRRSFVKPIPPTNF